MSTSVLTSTESLSACKRTNSQILFDLLSWMQITMNFRLVSKFSKETSSPDNFRSPSPMLNQPNLSSRSCMQSAAISKLNNLTLRLTKPLALTSRNKKLSVVYSWALTSRTSSAGQPRSASNKQRSTLKMCLKSSRRKILKRALDLT